MFFSLQFWEVTIRYHNAFFIAVYCIWLVAVLTTLYSVSHGLTRVAIMLWPIYSCALYNNKDAVILITHVMYIQPGWLSCTGRIGNALLHLTHMGCSIWMWYILGRRWLQYLVFSINLWYRGAPVFIDFMVKHNFWFNIYFLVCNYVIHEKCRNQVATPCTSYLTDHIKVCRFILV
mgnify:CR=1 FL=1